MKINIVMKYKRSLTVLLIFTIAHSAFAQEMDATEIVRKADQKTRGNTSQGNMTMKIVRPDWERTVEMKTWSKGDEYFLIYITAPAKDEGQVFLKRENEMWHWLPSIDRMIKIPPSMMMQSWMGSDFTNDDLVKQSSIVVDYEHTLLGEQEIRSKKCYKIKLVPKPEAPVVWGEIIIWITVEGYNIWKTEYYNEDGELENIENAYDLEDVGDRVIPTRIVITPADEEGKKTILIFDDITYNQPIEDDFFSIRNMKRIKG